MRTVRLGKTQEQIPSIGLGTWKMAEGPAPRHQEIEALRQGVMTGATLIDTAEIYAGGEAERIVAEVIKDCRDEIFLVTKVWPTNGTYDGVCQAVARSLDRLGTDRIDLYLLHWPSAEHPIKETMRGMRRVVADEEVRWVGVSNFDVQLMEEAQDALGDVPLTCNQVVYHLNNRIIEKSIIPYCVEHDITVMAYSPLGAGDFPAPGTPGRMLLDEIGAKYGKTAHQVALNWVISRDKVMAIPKASTPRHAVDNAQAASFTLTAEEVARIDQAFPVSAGEFTVQRY